jgi:hypothetical protein
MWIAARWKDRLGMTPEKNSVRWSSGDGRPQQDDWLVWNMTFIVSMYWE